MTFSYPALPIGVDAIRLFKIDPGDFSSPLVGTLTPTAFSDRPKYVALSYTWGSSYPDNSNLPVSVNNSRFSPQSPGVSPDRLQSRVLAGPKERKSILTEQPTAVSLPVRGASLSPNTTSIADALTLNDHPFRIGHNLHLAILHLRSPTHPITVWIDAICINQADSMERSSQVSLMAFIYTRATKVLSWLGTKDYPPMTGLFRSMSLEWKAGQTQHFGAFLMGDINMRFSPQPTVGALARIVDSAYWKRLWVVQEMCLPRILILMYGSDIWTFEEFRGWVYPPTTNPELCLTRLNPGCGQAALRLLETRDQKHTDMMRLESLIERSAKSECSELRDRIYGLLGCANDIRPFSQQDDQADALKSHIDSLSCGRSSTIQLKRGIGSLKVDYFCPFYDLWAKVVGFVYFQAKISDRNVNDIQNKVRLQDVAHHRVMDLHLEERKVSIVRTAGVVQDALDQKLEEEVMNHKESLSEQERPVITAIGYIAGEIVQLGPDYMSLIGSSSAAQDWTSCWGDHYQEARDMEIIRGVNEGYMAKILNYQLQDLNRIRSINDPHVLAWRNVEDRCDLSMASSSQPIEHTLSQAGMTDKNQAPQICLGTGHVMGLVPSTATPGDIIVRFWNCNAAMVMRPVKSESVTTAFMLVGRADVADVIETARGTPSNVQSTWSLWTSKPLQGSKKDSYHSGAVYVDLSLKTLQKITAYITT